MQKYVHAESLVGAFSGGLMLAEGNHGIVYIESAEVRRRIY